MTTGLIIVDEQPDFCEGGSLAVAGGNTVCRETAAALASGSFGNMTIVTTQDWHMDPGDHFSSAPDYEDTWPPHCVAGTRGAELHPALRAALGKQWSESFYKGMTCAAYSAFEGVANLNGTLFALHHYLQDHDVESIFVCGLALEKCVAATIYGGLNRGYKVSLIENLTAAIHPDDEAECKALLIAAGCEMSHV